LQAPPSYTPATFAPKPQASAFSTPILTQSVPEDEPEVIRYIHNKTISFHIYTNQYSRQWREKQQAEINARDEASKRRREDTVASAEHDIEEFYENYSKKKERSIRDNKSVFVPHHLLCLA